MIRHFTYKASAIYTFLREGEGLPFVFIHGFCEDSTVWDDFLEGFSKSPLLRIDLPGFGRSGINASFSIADMAHCVYHVFSQIGLEKCILIGHSMGGYVGLKFAKYYEDRLLGICMFHSQPFADTPEKKLNRQKGIDFITDNGTAGYVKQLVPKLFSEKNTATYADTIGRLIENASSYPSKGIINGLAAMKNREDNSKVLQNISCPVSFIIGESDKAIPAENSLKQTALPSVSSIHILKDVGHMGMFEAKEECISIIRDFTDFVAYYNTLTKHET